jgi:hypothetical protein
MAGTRSLAPLIAGTFALPNSSPFTSVANNYWEMRFHNVTLPGSGQNIFCNVAGGYCVQFDGAGNVQAVVSKDTVGSNPAVSVAGLTDFIVVLSRNVNTLLWTLEVFNTTTGSCASAPTSINVLGNNDWHGTGGGFATTGFVASVPYVRWYSGTRATACTQMPLETDAPGNLLDYEFENNLNDSSGNSIALAMSGPTYAATPTYAPTCQGQDPGSAPFPANVARANVAWPVTWVTCISENAGTAITYSWTLGTCPNGTLSNPTSATPRITVTAFGQCILNLAVSDSVPNTANVSTTLGAVVTDALDRVLTGNATQDLITGPMLRLGSLRGNAYFDDRNVAWADMLGGLQGNSDHQDVWNVHLTGNVDVVTTGGATTIVGHNGTTFKNDLCGGGSSQPSNQLLVVWIGNGLAVGGTRRVSLPIGSATYTCNTDSLITLSAQYNGPTATGVQYSVWPNAGNWVNPSENFNYYDNALAFRSLYLRTGLTRFETYFTTLVDRWFTMPEFDQGLLDPNVDNHLQPRIIGYTGMVMRALDGRSNMWPGLEHWCDFVAGESTTWRDDIREDGYRLSQLGLCGFADTGNPTHEATAKAAAAAMINNLWQNYRLPSGSWSDDQIGGFGYAACSWGCTQALSGTVSVGNGDTTMVLTGGTWDSTSYPSACNLPCPIWLSPSNMSPANSPYPKDNSGGDSVTFKIMSFTDSTHLVIDRPYDGTLAGTGRGYMICALCGWGTQPFMLGVDAGAFAYAYTALNGYSGAAGADVLAKQYAQDAVKFIASSGPAVNYYGLFYGRNWANCEPMSKALLDPNCSQTLDNISADIQGIRYLNMEVMHGFCAAYLLAGSQVILDSARWLFNAAFGPYDANFLDSYLSNTSSDFTAHKAKTLGFGFGWGLGACAAAVSTYAPLPSRVGVAGGTTGLLQ